MIRGALRAPPSRAESESVTRAEVTRPQGEKLTERMDEDAETHHDDEDAAVDADGAAAAAAAGDEAEK